MRKGDALFFAGSVALMLLVGATGSFRFRAANVNRLVPIATREGEYFCLEDGNLLLHINAASEEMLCQLDGVGPALAERIVAWREMEGSFTSLDDLAKVRGVGKALLKTLADKICFD